MAADNRTQRKRLLRQALRQRRRALEPGVRDQAERDCAHQLQQWPQWISSRHVAAYRASDGEMATQLIAQAAVDQGKHFYLPVIDGKYLRFARWEPGDVLQSNRYGIGEPTGAKEPIPTIDLLLMPLVGWSSDGGRLGMGGGYYDRSLAAEQNARALRVGLAFDCQRLDEDTSRDLWDDWDLALNAVVTESELRVFDSDKAPTERPDSMEQKCEKLAGRDEEG